MQRLKDKLKSDRDLTQEAQVIEGELKECRNSWIRQNEG